MKTKHIKLFTASTIALAPAISISVKAQEMQETQQPNVIIILADDVGYGDLSINGEKTIHTPNVEKLANMGVRFTDAHAVAATSTPSRYSLLTGQYAWRKSGTGIAAGDAGMVIRPEQSTIASVF